MYKEKNTLYNRTDSWLVFSVQIPSKNLQFLLIILLQGGELWQKNNAFDAVVFNSCTWPKGQVAV